MMRSVLWRWLLAHFAARMALVGAAMLGLYALGEVFDKVRYLDAQFTAGKLVEFVLLRAPGVFARYAPLIVLFGAFIALVELAMRRESIALRAVGVGPRRALAPLGLVAGLVGLGAFALGEWTLPAAKRAARMERVLIHHAKLVPSTSRWLHDGRRFFRITPLGEGVFRVRVLEVDREGHWRRWLEAERARYAHGAWTLWKVRMQTPAPEGGVRELKLPRLRLASRASPGATKPPPPSLMRFGELRRYIRLLEEAGVPAESYRFAWHRRLAVPLEALAAALAAFALAFHLHPRAGGITLAIAGALAAALWLVVSAQLASLLGGAGAWPAWFAAYWPAAVLALTAGGILLRREGY